MAKEASSKALAKVIVLSKDEYDLIEDFLMHHGRIFGYENIVVVDNGSTDPRVLKVYAEYIKKGVTIEVDKDRGMLSMAQIMTDAMRRHAPSCHFLVPLDTDEFVFEAHRSASSFSADRVKEHLHEYLQDVNVSIVRYTCFLGSIPDPASPDYKDHKHNRPARNIVTFFNQGWDKLIVRSDCFVSISQGNHHAQITGYGETVTSPLLGLLHFHETGGARKRERCIMSMKGYGQWFNKLDLDGEIAACDRLVSQQLFGGHRVEQYRELLRREKVCRMHWQLVGSLPSAEVATELAREESKIWGAGEEHDEKRLVTVILQKTDMRLWDTIGCHPQTNIPMAAMESIILHEAPTMKKVIRVTQVADALS